MAEGNAAEEVYKFSPWAIISFQCAPEKTGWPPLIQSDQVSKLKETPDENISGEYTCKVFNDSDMCVGVFRGVRSWTATEGAGE
ncbi:MAG: hypothetical protein OXC00_14370 [Acidimicrobiaceae bacterium]|nr:hypothetical protein [Acidimicrobiaceae bacterium]